MLRRYLQIIWVLLPFLATAQVEDVFTAKKPQQAIPLPQGERDTFLVQVFASQKGEERNRIVYRTAIQIQDEQTLVLFKATQGIIDSLKWLTDKNANTGDWRKLEYETNGDTLYFTYNEVKQRMGDETKTVKVTHSFIAVVQTGKLSVTEITGSDSDAQVPPRIDTTDFMLVSERPLVRKR